MTQMEKSHRQASYILNVCWLLILNLEFDYASPLDVAESSIDLTHTGNQFSSSSENSQEDVTKKTTFEQKTKQSKLSKGIMEFISMGDPIGYADKKIAK